MLQKEEVFLHAFLNRLFFQWEERRMKPWEKTGRRPIEGFSKALGLHARKLRLEVSWLGEALSALVFLSLSSFKL